MDASGVALVLIGPGKLDQVTAAILLSFMFYKYIS